MENYTTLSQHTKENLREMLGDHPEVNTKTTKDELIKHLLMKQSEGESLEAVSNEEKTEKKEPEEKTKSDTISKRDEENKPDEGSEDGEKIYAYTLQSINLRTDRCEELTIVGDMVVHRELVCEDIKAIVKHKMYQKQYLRNERR